MMLKSSVKRIRERDATCIMLEGISFFILIQTREFYFSFFSTFLESHFFRIILFIPCFFVYFTFYTTLLYYLYMMSCLVLHVCYYFCLVRVFIVILLIACFPYWLHLLYNFSLLLFTYFSSNHCMFFLFTCLHASLLTSLFAYFFLLLFLHTFCYSCCSYNSL